MLFLRELWRTHLCIKVTADQKEFLFRGFGEQWLQLLVEFILVVFLRCIGTHNGKGNKASSNP